MKPFSTVKVRHQRGPKYEWVKTWLRDQISSGKFPAGYRLPPQDKLPQMLGVKVAEITVRRALNDLAHEGLIVRRRRLGSFVAGRVTRPLIPGRNLHIGVLWPDSVAPQQIHNSFNGQMTLGILDALGVDANNTASWSIPSPHEATGCSWNQPECAVKLSCIGQAVQSRERHPSLEAVNKAGLDGIICLNIIENDWLEKLLSLDMPTVLADYPLDDFRDSADHVFVDPLPAMRAAVEFFLKKGARSFHYVGVQLAGAAPSPDSSLREWREKHFVRKRDDPDSLLREFAFRRVLNEQGISVREDQFHRISYDAGQLENLTQRLLSLPPETRPDTVICHDLRQHAEPLVAAFASKGLVLNGTGVTDELPGIKRTPLPALLADGIPLGQAAAELLVSRFLRKTRPHFSVGVEMQFYFPGQR